MKKKASDGINEINKICKLILELKDSDFEEIEKVIDSQKNYYNPLKMKSTIIEHQLADHNTKVVNALKELKLIIELGKDADK